MGLIKSTPCSMPWRWLPAVAEPLKVITRGRGPELVLLHGWAMHSGIWGGLLDSLSSAFSVNLVDLPGHGVNRHVPLSADLREVAGEILARVPEAAWIGWSLGGLVTLAAAIQQPQRVQKAILVGATPSFVRRPGWDCGVDSRACRAFSEALVNNPAGTAEQFWSQCFGAPSVAESLRLLGKSSVMDDLPMSTDLEAGLRLLYDNDLLAESGHCKVPTLFLGGARDRTILPESFTRAAALMPAGEARVMRGAGHAPFITHRDAFLDIIRGYLNGDNAA